MPVQIHCLTESQGRIVAEILEAVAINELKKATTPHHIESRHTLPKTINAWFNQEVDIFMSAGLDLSNPAIAQCL